MSNNPWLERRVITYAHQGGAHEGPSSCLATIAAALEVGATAIELDVHATKDRHLVVCHDETVDRTTAATGKIAELTLGEIQALDNAYWWMPGSDVAPGFEPEAYPLRGYAPTDRSYGIATLAEVLERFPDVVLNMDIKQTSPTVEPYEELLADLLRSYGRQDSVIISSFNDQAIAAFHAYAPEFSIGAGTLEVAEFYRVVQAGTTPAATKSVALQVPATYGEVVLVDQRFVDVAHEVGKVVHVWTINDPSTMDDLLDLGVDGIISDVPSVLVERVEAKGLTWRGF